MKKISYLFFAGFIILAGVSCDNILSENPQNKLSPSSVSDYEELLNNGYPGGKDYSTGEPLAYYTAFMTDDAGINYYNANNNRYPLIAYSFFEAPTPSGTQEDQSMWLGEDLAWKNWYKAIYYANLVIKNIDDATGKAQSRNYLKGEALTLRAFSYFELVNLYGKPYNEKTASNDLGVPIKLDPAVQKESFSRSSVQEVYDQIQSDLSSGMQLMEENNLNLTTKSKLTPIAAHLLASRIALFKKKYKNVITQTSTVISQNPSLFDLSQYTLQYAQSSWGYGQGTHYIANEDNSNVLFIYGSNPFYRISYAATGALSVSQDLINTYAKGDLRLYYFTRDGSQGRTYFKYRPYPFYINQPVRGFRVEEAYLNRAEAYAETGNKKGALDDLNKLRKHKFDPVYYHPYKTSEFSSSQQLIDTVRTERRRELMFEYHRWFDLRRYGMPKLTHTYKGKTYTLKKDDPRYVLQIPQHELDQNPKMKKNPR